MIVRKIKIGSQSVPFAASARTPSLYQQMYGSDLLTDMTIWKARIDKILADHGVGNMKELDTTTQASLMDARLMENVAYCMAKQADSDLPDKDEWLDQFNMFDLYDAYPKIFDLWTMNQKGTSIPKKK